ncbi:MAG: hypothetical protein R3326_03300 [Gemmatimonadota bacterium]|nr:hypothetical protein [Gemmatimonadota bacterium]
MSEEPTPAQARPRPVEILDRALADWLSAFTVPGELAGEMADACAAGAEWPGAVAAVAAREADWEDAHAMAWGIAVGAQAGALEAARRSLETEAGVNPAERPRPADGPATSLLASDALVAGAHEALSSLSPDRLAEALEMMERVFGGGGPWCGVASGRSESAAALGLALLPLGDRRPSGELAELVEAARERARSVGRG